MYVALPEVSSRTEEAEECTPRYTDFGSAAATFVRRPRAQRIASHRPWAARFRDGHNMADFFDQLDS